jgi:hypothetical protein
MLESELKNLWKSSGDEFQINLEKIRNAYSLEKKVDRFDRTLFWRNIREYLAVVLVIAIFGFYIFYLPMSLLTKIGSVLIILASIFYACKIWYTRKQKKPITIELALVDELKALKEYLVLESKMLKDIFKWSLLPSIPGLLLFHIGTYPFSQLLGLNSVMGMTFIIATYIGVWWINQRAVKKEFIPLLNDLDAQIKSWEE